MALQIRISPEALRAASEQFLNIAISIDEITAKISALSTQLNDAWDGGASRVALGTFSEFKDASVNISNGTKEAAQKLKEIANAFESIDRGSGFGAAVIFDAFARIRVACPRPVVQIIGDVIGSIRIIPDEVRVVSEHCNVVANEISESAERLNAVLNSLQGEWEGRAFDRFYNNSMDLYNVIMEQSESVHEFAAKLAKTAAQYDEVDSAF